MWSSPLSHVLISSLTRYVVIKLCGHLLGSRWCWRNILKHKDCFLFFSHGFSESRLDASNKGAVAEGTKDRNIVVVVVQGKQRYSTDSSSLFVLLAVSYCTNISLPVRWHNELVYLIPHKGEASTALRSFNKGLC